MAVAETGISRTSTSRVFRSCESARSRAGRSGADRGEHMVMGTWNMEGRRGEAQSDFPLSQACDVWLLTEVPVDWTVPGFYLTRCDQLMGSSKH